MAVKRRRPESMRARAREDQRPFAATFGAAAAAAAAVQRALCVLN